MKELDAGLEDSKFQVCPLFEELVAEGNLGRKTGKGFFVNRLKKSWPLTYFFSLFWSSSGWSAKAQTTMDVSEYYHPSFSSKKCGEGTYRIYKEVLDCEQFKD
jgi:3-hydroxyacyl-CoA dehydrogenase